MELRLLAVALSLSGFLLFSVQPMMGKLVLPLLGGGPSVWATCMLFFQAALLAGYVYAHLIAPRQSLRRQVGLHVLVLLMSAAALPIRIPSWGLHPPASSATSVPWLCLLLSATVGLPFFALSANAPLLQSWFARGDGAATREPYILYAASNGGSLAGLASYPFLVEPRVPLGMQSTLWTVGYALLVLLVIGAGLGAVRRSSAGAFVSSPDAGGRPQPEIGIQRIFLWIALAAVPSSLMLGFTTYVSTEIAPAPLLWIFPLGLFSGTPLARACERCY